MPSSKLSGIKKSKSIKRRASRRRVSRRRATRHSKKRGGDSNDCPKGGDHKWGLIGVGEYKCIKCGARMTDH